MDVAALALNYSFLDVLAAGGVQVLSRFAMGPSGIGVQIKHRKRLGSIIVTQADYPDDVEEWIHASIDFTGEMPTYDDLALLHHAVFGRKRYAYQVFAPESDHVNIRETALHLWGRADGARVTPNFGRYGTI